MTASANSSSRPPFITTRWRTFLSLESFSWILALSRMRVRTVRHPPREPASKSGDRFSLSSALMSAPCNRQERTIIPIPLLAKNVFNYAIESFLWYRVGIISSYLANIYCIRRPLLSNRMHTLKYLSRCLKKTTIRKKSIMRGRVRKLSHSAVTFVMERSLTT